MHYGPEVSVEILNGVQVQNSLPTEIVLLQNYPNPLNPATVIHFSVAQPVHATLKIYDMLGQEAATLVDENLDAGTYDRYWDAEGFAGGVYLYRLTAGSFSQTRKLIIVK